MSTTLERYHAAMYTALGCECQLSASGYNLIFAKGYRLNDRADLSDHTPTARAQLEYAGLSPDDVAPYELEQYQEWRRSADDKHIHDKARILITAPRGEHQYRKVTGIELQVGYSPVYVTAVDCLQVYDPEAINLMGHKGAYRLLPDSEKIRQALDQLRREHPEFAHAPIANNAEAELEEPNHAQP